MNKSSFSSLSSVQKTRPSRLVPRAFFPLIAHCSLLIAFLATACASNPFDKPLDKLADYATVAEAQILTVTNYIDRIEIRELPGENRTITNVIAVPQIEYRTNLIYLAKPAVEKTLAVTSAGAAFIPPPWNLAVEAGLGIMSGFLAFLVKRRNGEKKNLETQLTAVVHGVEKISDALPVESKHIKSTIAKTAEALGIATDLYKTVKKLT